MSTTKHLTIADVFGQAIEHARDLGFTTREITEQMRSLLRPPCLGRSAGGTTTSIQATCRTLTRTSTTSWTRTTTTTSTTPKPSCGNWLHSATGPGGCSSKARGRSAMHGFGSFLGKPGKRRGIWNSRNRGDFVYMTLIQAIMAETFAFADACMRRYGTRLPATGPQPGSCESSIRSGVYRGGLAGPKNTKVCRRSSGPVGWCGVVRTARQPASSSPVRA